MEIKENNRKVVSNLRKEGYNLKEISLLTNNSIFKVLRYLNMKKA